MNTLAWGLRLTAFGGLVSGWSWVSGLELPGCGQYACLAIGQWLLLRHGPSPLARLLVPLSWVAALWSAPLSAMLGMAYLFEVARKLGLELPRQRLAAAGSWLGIAVLMAAATLMSAILGLALIGCLSGSITVALGILAIRECWGAMIESISAIEFRQAETEWNGYTRY